MCPWFFLLKMFIKKMMRKLFSLLLLTLPTSFIFSQTHLHDDTEIAMCRNEKKQFTKNYLLNSEYSKAFRAYFNISADKFFELNPIYAETMTFLIGNKLCNQEINTTQIATEVNRFIELNRNNLLFQESIGINGEKLLGKFIYEGNPDNSVFPLAAGDPCTNPDFSSNNYTGWETFCGTTNGTAYTVVGTTQYVPGNNAPCGNTAQHTIFTGGTDPVVPSIQCVNPNGPLGGASVRIGDGTGTGARGAVLRQTFLVSAASSAFSYSYAAILEDPGHSPNQQPFFKANIYDQNNNPIICGQYQAYAGDGQNGWVDLGSYVYRNWTTNFVDLTPYIGQNVTVEFSVGDCSPTAHYAYAYVQAACTSLDITMSAPAICSGQPVTITAPASAQNYLWNTGNNTQTIVATIPGTYTVNLTPNNTHGPNCSMSLSVNVPAAQSPTANFTYSNTILCEKDTIYFQNTSTIPGNDTIQGVSWSFGDGISIPNGFGVVNGVSQTGGTHTDPSHYYLNYGNKVVTMTVTSQNGCKATTTKTIQMLFTPTVIAGNDISICQGQTATLTASGAVSYSWSGGAPHNTAFEPPVGTNVYYVTGVGATGCKGIDSIVVNVSSGPQLFAGNDTTLCLGDTLILNAITQIPSFSWNNGVQNNVPFVPTISTSYIVSGTQAGCAGRDTIQVTINNLPNINAGNDTIVCENATIALSAQGGVSYVWNNSVTNGIPFTPNIGAVRYGVLGTDANGCSNTDSVLVTTIAVPSIIANNDTSVCAGNAVTLTASGTAPSFNWSNGVQNGVAFIPAVSQWYYVNYTTPQGCATNDSVYVTVNAKPVVNAGNDISICEGSSFVLQHGGTANNYSWSNNFNSNSPIFLPVGSYNLVLTGSSNAGCVEYDTVLVTVNPSPNVNAGMDQSICWGDSVVLNAIGVGAPFVWNYNVQNNVAFNPTETRQYIVQTQAVNGCIGRDTVNVIVHNLPTIQLEDSLFFCENTPIVLTVNGNGTVVWSNNVQNGVAFQQNVGSQYYTVIVTDANNCSNSDSIKVVVVAAPDAQLAANPTVGIAPLPVDFLNNSSGNYTNAIWNFGNNQTLTTLDSLVSHTYTQPGEYTVVLTISNAYCEDTTSIIILVDDKPIEPLKYVIPNVFTPNGDGSNDEYHFSLENAEYVKAYVYNRWGSFVALYDDVNGAWDGNHESGEKASDGVYFVVYEIKGLDGTFVQGSTFVHLFSE